MWWDVFLSHELFTGKDREEKGERKGRKEGRNPGCIACIVVPYDGRRMGDEGREGKRGWHPSTRVECISYCKLPM